MWPPARDEEGLGRALGETCGGGGYIPPAAGDEDMCSPLGDGCCGGRLLTAAAAAAA